MLTHYANNSPEALARIVAMILISDTRLDDSEFEQLDKMHFYSLLKITPRQFMEVLHAYCGDISDEADVDGSIHLVDLQRINHALDSVTDDNLRLLVCTIALDITKANREIGEAEMAIFTHMLNYWHICLEDIAKAFA